MRRTARQRVGTAQPVVHAVRYVSLFSRSKRSGLVSMWTQKVRRKCVSRRYDWSVVHLANFASWGSFAEQTRRVRVNILPAGSRAEQVSHRRLRHAMASATPPTSRRHSHSACWSTLITSLSPMAPDVPSGKASWAGRCSVDPRLCRQPSAAASAEHWPYRRLHGGKRVGAC